MRQQERRQQAEPDDPQLPQRLQVERVGVAHGFGLSPSRAHQYSNVPEPVPVSGFSAFSLTAELQNW